MITIENAQLVLKDKNGNVARIQNLGPADIVKINNAIADIGKLVDPVSHLPIKATANTVGVVQLADDKAIAAGTTGRVVDAKQLQDAVLGVSPANCVTNVAAGSTANKITVSKDGGYTTTIVIDNVEHAGTATSANSVAWANVSGKPSSFTPSSHTHDDRYYTESEIDTKLGGKANTNHTHSNYLTGITKAMVTNALGYTPPTQDTNTWNALKGSTTSAAGTAGYAPAPAAGAANRYLRCDGTWQVPPDTNTTYSKLSQFTNDSGYITSSGSCAYATSAGNGVDSYGTGWIRFKNGIQICYASAEFQQTVVYQKAFASEPRLVCTAAEKRGETQEIPQLLVVNFYSKHATSFAGRVWNVDREDWEEEGNFDWIAIGSWK